MDPKGFAHYLKSRYEDQLDFYGRRSAVNKWIYCICTLLIIVFSLSVPIVIAYGFHRDILVVVSSLVAILSSVIAAFRFHEKWMNYRSTAELLKRERPLYDSEVGPYENAVDREALFVKRVEALISREHIEWLSIWDEKKKKNP